VHGVAGETCALPHETALLGQQAGDFPADELVRDGFLAVRVQLVRVGHIPRPARGAVVIAHRRPRRRQLGLPRIEGVAVGVLFAPDLAFALHGVDFEDGVIRAVDVGVDAETEEVLVVVRVDPRVYFRAPRRRGLARVQGVGVQDAREFDLELDRAVLVEDPVDAVPTIFISLSGATPSITQRPLSRNLLP